MAMPTEADLNDELLNQHKRAADLACFLAFNASEHHRIRLMETEQCIALLKQSLSHVQAANNIESMKRCAAAIQEHVERMQGGENQP